MRTWRDVFPQEATITQRRLLGQSARHDLDDYRRAKAMELPDLERLKALARAHRKIVRAAQLEGYERFDAMLVVLADPASPVPPD